MIFLAFLLFACLASTFHMGAQVVKVSDSFFFVGFRMILAGLLMLSYLFFFNKKYFKIQRKDLWLFVQFTLSLIFLSYNLEFLGMRYLNPSKACLFFSMTPFITVIFERFIFSTKITFKKFIGLVIGILGYAPLVMAKTVGAESTVAHVAFFSWPELIMLGSVVCYSYGWIVMKELSQVKQYSPILINGVGMFSGGVATMVMALSQPLFFNVGPLVTNWPLFLTFTLLMIFVANIIGYNLYGYLLRFYSATFMSLLGFVAPLFSALIGYTLGTEVLTWHFFVSAITVFIGLIIFHQDELVEVTN
ncbi:MAG: hypothetical protein UR26_C0005G0036 [candidate division TM6 bacterium GW2011_GWF2_32_72]|nr:MAG: hypothetical protein UR26_C0005G0036 [candidate division TM6 bacterium GW2011_GWF2_32_72]